VGLASRVERQISVWAAETTLGSCHLHDNEKVEIIVLSGYECNSQISSTTEFLNSCKNGNYVKDDIEEHYVKHGIE
jgi:hypothetical protein